MMNYHGGWIHKHFILSLGWRVHCPLFLAAAARLTKGLAMAKTRTVQHENGRIEVIRILDDEVLTHWTEWNPLAYEASIVWLEDVQSLDYVRAQWVNYCEHRRNELIPQGKGRVLGYSRLTVDAPRNPKTGFYTRRVFFLLETEDGRIPADGVLPQGAVDPKSIAPSLFGQLLGTNAPAPVTPKLERWKADRIAPSDQKIELTPGVYGVLVPVHDAGGQIRLNKTEITIGRLETCDVSLPHRNVSATHCRLTWVPEDFTWFVVDENSTRGTFINGERIPPYARTRLESDAALAVADHVFRIVY